jgi:adenine-specific DNA-methyltransferase
MQKPEPYYQDDAVTIYHGDCREIVPTLGRFDLVLTDPPYGKVKGEFDHMWTNRPAMLKDCKEWAALIAGAMKSNATLYWFAWPTLAGRIEAIIAEHLHLLSHIVWRKPSALGLKCSAETLRAPMPVTERIIMAEQYGADSYALGESGYATKCDELRAFVFEPLRAYLAGEFQRAGMLTNAGKIAANVACGFSASAGGMASRHYFSRSQWQLPTETHYEALRELLNQLGDREESRRAGYLRREYEDLRREYEDLRREYEDLRREYEDLRRYFDCTHRDQKTDLWEFKPSTERIAHPTVKPLDLILYMIKLSARPGATILDPFAGSGTTGRAAKDLGRKAVLIEREERYCEIAALRMAQEVLPL